MTHFDLDVVDLVYLLLAAGVAWWWFWRSSDKRKELPPWLERAP